MELADPGIGVADGIELLNKRQILVGNIAGYPHLPHRMHGEPHRIGVDHFLHIGPIRLLEIDIGDLFQLLGSLDRDKSIAGQHHLKNSHQQQMRHLDPVNTDFLRAIGEAELLQ